MGAYDSIKLCCDDPRRFYHEKNEILIFNLREKMYFVQFRGVSKECHTIEYFTMLTCSGSFLCEKT